MPQYIKENSQLNYYLEISVEQGYGGYGDCGGIAYGGGRARQIQEYEENIKEL